MEPRRSSILRISDEKTLELISLYEKEECLWNTELSSYKNRSKRRAATQRIAKALAIDKFDARHVAIKFKNLRNSYCQEFKKMAYGSSPDDRSKVWWFGRMDSFLRPHLQSSAPWDLSSLKQEEKENGSFLEESRSSIIEESRSSTIEESMDQKMSDQEDITIESETEEKVEIRSLRKRPKPPTKRQSPTQEKRKKNIEKEKLQNEESSSKSYDDCFDSFGRYVASMLKTMPKQKAMMLQPKIVTLLTSVNFEDEDSETDTWDKIS